MRTFFFPMLPFIFILNNAFADTQETLKYNQYNQYQQLSIQGQDLFLGETVRLPSGNWNAPLNVEIDNMAPTKWAKPKNLNALSCSLPNEARKKFSGEESILYCGTTTTWFFQQNSYCSENDSEERISSQNANAAIKTDRGHLWAYDHRTGSMKSYPDFLHLCEFFSNSTLIGKELWITTHYKTGYDSWGKGGNNIYILDLEAEEIKKPPSDITEHKFTNPLIKSIAHLPGTEYIWISTQSGLDRYSLKNHSWEQRYFDFSISPPNKLQLNLLSQRPSEEKLWLDSHLFFLPIDDPNGFANAWKGIALYEKRKMKDGIPLLHPALFPHYASALLNMPPSWDDETFTKLLNAVSEYEGKEAELKSLMEKLMSTPMSQIRKNSVAQIARKMNIADSPQLMEKQFNLTVSDFFTKDIENYSALKVGNFCHFVFNQPQYLPMLNEYYLTHKIGNQRLNSEYMSDCVRAHMHWQGSEFLLPSVLKFLNESTSIYDLDSACSVFNHYSNPAFRSKEYLFNIFQARYKVGTPKEGHGYACLAASYWITNSAENIDELLEKIDASPHLIPIAIDVLHEITRKKFDNISAWSTWWKSNRQTFRPSNKIFDNDTYAPHYFNNRSSIKH